MTMYLLLTDTSHHFETLSDCFSYLETVQVTSFAIYERTDYGWRLISA